MNREEKTHAVRNVRCAPGELSFDVDLDGAERTVWFKTDAPVTPNADAALATCLMAAMTAGGTLAIDAPISARLLRTQRELQAIQRTWSLRWTDRMPPLSEVEVAAPTRPLAIPTPGRAVATFFSGGVDSWSTILGNPDVTQLVFVRGMDLPTGRARLTDDVETRLRDAAHSIGLPIWTVETNLRELTEGLVPWDLCFGGALAAVALLLEPLVERFLIAGDSDYEVMVDQGANPLTDHLWSTETLEVVHYGGRLSRVERLREISSDPVVQRTLRVCWENRDGAYNCGRCRKCLMTMTTLEALGVRERFATFPSLELDALADVHIGQVVLLTLWQDILDLSEARECDDLAPAVAEVVARGKRELGLPDSYRRRGSANGRVGTAERNDFEARMKTMLESRSWRLTAPLRRAGAAARRLRR